MIYLKFLTLVIFAFALFNLGLNTSQASQGARGRTFQREGGGRGGSGGYGKGKSVPSFPKYPSKPSSSYNKGPSKSAPRESNPSQSHAASNNHVPAHSDSLGNRVTQDHMNRVDFAHNRSEAVMRNDPRVTDSVRMSRARFSNFYRPEFDRRTVVFNGFVNRYNSIVISHPLFLNTWHNHFFFGGLYWGFHPIVDIDVYFYNPMVYWFYVGTFDDYYYRNWYRGDYDAYPELHKPFDYHGLYYPTENLRQLLFGVSAMTPEKQARFRTAISIFTKKLAQNMANGLNTHVKLANGDIAVTHYEVIGYDDAVDLEGIATYKGESYNFKGLVDLENPDQSDVFVPATWDKNPSTEQLAKLDSLNARINAIKGVPSTEGSAEPAEQPMTAPPPGEVSADPI